MSVKRSLLVTVMTSDNKTVAYLARRVSSLEKSLEAAGTLIEKITANQAEFFPIVNAILEGIEKNGAEHDKILKHLGIE